MEPSVEGVMKIGIISDTHDNVINIKKAVEIFEKKDLDFVIHLGDVITPATVKFFKPLKMKFIRGNCDGAELDRFKEKIEEIKGEFYPNTLSLELNGKSIFCSHRPMQDVIDSGQYDYVLYGHTHAKRDEKIGKTRVINPGSHYYGGENTIAILDIDNDHVESIEVA